MKAPFLRTPYNYDMNKAGDESALACKDPTLTQQSFAEEVDINTIVRRFGLTGELPTNVRMPQYGDYTEVMDYHQAMTAIRMADESFYSMPADVRARFDNNPGKFVDFCLDEKNLDEAIKLGLAIPRPADPTPKPPPGPSSEPPPPRGREKERHLNGVTQHSYIKLYTVLPAPIGRSRQNSNRLI